MSNKLYVGNLSYSVSSSDLESAFGAYGSVSSATVLMDRDTGRSKGFGFVEMSNPSDAKSAISGLNGKPLDGRDMIVNEARPREERPSNGNRGGFNREGYGKRW